MYRRLHCCRIHDRENSVCTRSEPNLLFFAQIWASLSYGNCSCLRAPLCASFFLPWSRRGRFRPQFAAHKRCRRGQAGPMRFRQKVVGVGIVLGTAANIFFLPKRWGVGADEERPRLPRRSETDQRRWSRDRDNLTPVTREPRGGRGQEHREQEEQRGLAEGWPSVAQDRVKSEDAHRLQPQQAGVEPTFRDADDVWLQLAAAGLPAHRNRCLSPPCGEVRALSR